MNDKQIPGLDQSWAGAEKMLDRHFRKRRLLIVFFSLIIPALLTGLIYFSKGKTSGERNLSSVSSSAYITQKTISPYSNPKNSGINIKETERNKIDKPGSNLYQNNKKQTDIIPAVVSANLASTRSYSAGKESPIPFSSNRNEEINQQDNPVVGSAFSVISSNESLADHEVVFAEFLSPGFLPPSKKDLDVKNEFPSPKCKNTSSKVGLEATVYGGYMYVQKNISSNSVGDNYLQHRKNEEDPAMTPSIGLSLSASLNSWVLSVGAEYSVYGEKTNYYPYSNQPTLLENNYWQMFHTTYVDTDTAYIMGNQLFLNTTMQRVDSSYIVDSDTIYEYKYDARIAESNGYNRYYYFEFPIEVSYNINSGRFGFGFSGGVAPAILVHEKGNYIRSDGKGLDSFSEIEYFRKFVLNARVSADFYYRLSPRMKIVMRPQLRSNLNSVFNEEAPVRQKYYSGGVLFGITYFLN